MEKVTVHAKVLDIQNIFHQIVQHLLGIVGGWTAIFIVSSGVDVPGAGRKRDAELSQPFPINLASESLWKCH